MLGHTMEGGAVGGPILAPNIGFFLFIWFIGFFFAFLGFEPSKAGGHLAIQNIGFLARNIGFCTFGLSKTLVF